MLAQIVSKNSTQKENANIISQAPKSATKNSNSIAIKDAVNENEVTKFLKFIKHSEYSIIDS